MPGTPIEYANAIASQTANGNLLKELVEILTTQTAERPDVLFAMTLLGFALGAGLWIGWEFSKFGACLGRRALEKSRGEKLTPPYFERPEQAAPVDVER